MGYQELDISYWPVSIISCATFLLTYKYVNTTLSNALCDRYHNFPAEKQKDWNNRINSTLHSLILSPLALYILLYEDSVIADPVWGKSRLSKFCCATLIGYMLHDCILMIRHYKQFGEIFFFFHHGACIYAYYFVMTYNALPWFAMFRLIAEFSTPFVNIRWFMDVLGHPKSSILFIGNGVAMAVVFFCVRIIVMPYYWYVVWSIHGTSEAHELGRIWHVLTSSCFILDVINLFWMYKIFLGAKKVIVDKFKRKQG